MKRQEFYKKPLFKEAFFFLILVYAFNAIGMKFDLYLAESPMKEYDSLVHFFAAICVSIGVLWLYYYSGVFNPQNRNYKNFLLTSFLGILFVGVSWEIFELVNGTTFATAYDYPYDTTLDFAMDILGGLAASLYAYIKEISNSSLDELVQVKGEAPPNLPV